jgi:hypothetical protein
MTPSLVGRAESDEGGRPLIKEESGDAASGSEPGDDAEQRPPGPSDGEGRNRTGDTTIFSRVLYQLSYLA